MSLRSCGFRADALPLHHALGPHNEQSQRVIQSTEENSKSLGLALLSILLILPATTVCSTHRY